MAEYKLRGEYRTTAHHLDYDRFYHGVNEPLDVSSRQKYTETTMSFNVSIPLDWGENRTSVAMNYNQSSQSRSSTVSMTGSSGENSDLSWSVYGGYERYRNSNSDSSSPTTFGGNLQQNTGLAHFAPTMTRVITIVRKDWARPAPWYSTLAV